MAHFLLVYDAGVGGGLLSMERYDTGSQALEARFRAEADYRARSTVEVVTLAAASEDDLRRTHGRYFQRLRDMEPHLLS